MSFQVASHLSSNNLYGPALSTGYPILKVDIGCEGTTHTQGSG